MNECIFVLFDSLDQDASVSLAPRPYKPPSSSRSNLSRSSSTQSLDHQNPNPRNTHLIRRVSNAGEQLQQHINCRNNSVSNYGNNNTNFSYSRSRSNSRGGASDCPNWRDKSLTKASSEIGVNADHPPQKEQRPRVGGRRPGPNEKEKKPLDAPSGASVRRVVKSREASPSHTYAQILKNELKDEKAEFAVEKSSVVVAGDAVERAGVEEVVRPVSADDATEDVAFRMPKSKVIEALERPKSAAAVLLSYESSPRVIIRPEISSPTNEPIIVRPEVVSPSQTSQLRNEGLTEKLQRRSNFSTEFIPSLARTSTSPAPKQVLSSSLAAVASANDSVPMTSSNTILSSEISASSTNVEASGNKKHVSSFNIKISAHPRPAQIKRASSTPVEGLPRIARSNTMTLTPTKELVEVSASSSCETTSPNTPSNSINVASDVETFVNGNHYAETTSPTAEAVASTATTDSASPASKQPSSDKSELSSVTDGPSTNQPLLEMPSNSFVPSIIKKSHGMSDEEKLKAQEDLSATRVEATDGSTCVNHDDKVDDLIGESLDAMMLGFFCPRRN